jgi:hypothetical protein
MGTKITKCVCKHKYQDERYGLGNRAHTVRKDGDLVCTVCSRVRKK